MRETSESRGTVYALRDPKSGELRYVGQTYRPLGKHLAAHLSSARCEWYTRRPLHAWLRSLERGGAQPTIEPLVSDVPLELLRAEERRLIRELRSTGAKLLNVQCRKAAA